MKNREIIGVREHRVLCVPCAKKRGIDKEWGIFPDTITAQWLKSFKNRNDWPDYRLRCAECKKTISCK